MHISNKNIKPTKLSIAVFLINPINNKEFLIVKRPSDDDRLPNVWGLPAVSIQGDELPEQAVQRVGVEKLNTQIEPFGTLGIKRADRGSYELILMDIKAKLIGKEPDVQNAPTTNTKYVDQKWTSDLNLFKEAAGKGSICSQIVLDVNGIDY